MINVVDRVPTYPNRIKVTKSDGTSEYVTWERADEPTVAGTPINKALFDSIVEDIGLNKATTVYVSTAGSDALGDGSAANPYATINKAINSLPKNLNGFNAVIYIAAGNYQENVDVSRFFGGNVYLSGSPSAAVSITSLSVADGSMVVLSDIELSVTGNRETIAIGITNASLSCLSGVKIIGNSGDGVYANRGAECSFTSLVITGTTARAVFARRNSNVYIDSLSGGSNTGIGIRSDSGAKVAYGSSSLSAVTTSSASTGGRIYSGAQTSIPNY